MEIVIEQSIVQRVVRSAKELLMMVVLLTIRALTFLGLSSRSLFLVKFAFVVQSLDALDYDDRGYSSNEDYLFAWG